MKNWLKVFGVIALAAVIGFTFAACKSGSGDDDDDSTIPSTSGSLTITGLSAHNGKWVCATGITNMNDNSWILVGYDSASNNDHTLNLAKISNGSATVKVWKIELPSGKYSSYSGSDKNLMAMIGVANKATISDAEIDDPRFFVDGATVTVSFSGGKANVKFVSLMP